MKKQLAKLALTAALGLALTLLACEDKEKKPAAAPPPPTEKAGESIKSVKIGTQTWMAENLNIETAGSKCYDNKPENCQKYGRLYDWKTAKKACPSGWKLPSSKEWQTLVDLAGGFDTAGKFLKAKSGWDSNGNGTDKLGFTALPGGWGSSDGNFGSIGNYGSWWYNSSDAESRYMASETDGLYAEDFEVANMLYSIRCIKD